MKAIVNRSSINSSNNKKLKYKEIDSNIPELVDLLVDAVVNSTSVSKEELEKIITNFMQKIKFINKTPKT